MLVIFWVLAPRRGSKPNKDIERLLFITVDFDLYRLGETVSSCWCMYGILFCYTVFMENIHYFRRYFMERSLHSKIMISFFFPYLKVIFEERNTHRL